MTAFETWAAGVLHGVQAPIDSVNVDTLWAWSGAESLPRDRMSWCNPLNTTQPWPGARDMNSVGVKAYLTVDDAIAATVATLTNGYYPTILHHLRNSVPHGQWADACNDLGKWGTGCAWITRDYGAAPTSLLGDDMTPAEHDWLLRLYVREFGTAATAADSALAPYQAMGTKERAELDAIAAAVAKPEAPEVEPTSSPAITPQVAADLATIAGFLRKFGQ
jgi:hypothetical protein